MNTLHIWKTYPIHNWSGLMNHELHTADLPPPFSSFHSSDNSWKQSWISDVKLPAKSQVQETDFHPSYSFFLKDHHRKGGGV